MIPIQRITKTAVSPVQEAVPQPAAVKPTPVTTTGTIPGNVAEGLAKTPTSLALQHFPNAGRGVLNTPATRDDWNRLTRQAAVDQLKQADELAQDAMWLVGGRNPSHIDQVRAKAEMAEAAQIRKSVADRLAAEYPDKPAIGAGEGELLQGEILEADAEEQKAFGVMYGAHANNDSATSDGASSWKAATEKFQLIETQISEGQ